MTRALSDEMLMAFADGELAPEEQEEVEAALVGDESLAERLAVFMETRKELQAVMKPLIDEPVPSALQVKLAAAISIARDTHSGTSKPTEAVIRFQPRPLRTHPSKGSVFTSPWGMALAASLVGIVVGLGGFQLGQSTAVVSGPTSLALNKALDTLPSGGDQALNDSASLHMIASFRDAEGHFCREYELKERDVVTTAVACDGPAGWQTRFALSNLVVEGYVPASTEDTLDSFLSAIGAGAPLSLEQETTDIEARRSR